MARVAAVRLGLLGCAVLTACVTTVESELLYPEVDLSGWDTFAWIDPTDMRDPPSFARNELVDRRIRMTIDQVLVTEGYQKVEPVEADFLVTYHVTAAERAEFYGVRGSVSVQSAPYIDVAIFLDGYDAETKRLVWRGLVRQAFDNREAAIESIRRSVERLVDRFRSDTAP